MRMEDQFCGKVCVITGGANGIGRCMVEEFLRCGASVAMIDIDEERGKELAQSYCNEKLLFFCGDLSLPQVIENFCEEIEKKFQKVDILINNACISKKGILSRCSYENFEKVLKIGVVAPYYLTSLLQPLFTSGASIINISSTRAQMSQMDTESYSAAKGGIHALTHALSVSLSGKVRVNSISPGWIETGEYQKENTFFPHSEQDKKQHPAGRVGFPLDVVKTAMFLCSQEAGFITGENITVDGGMTKQMIYHGDEGWRLHLTASGAK